jgi:hypothetical protein
MTYAGAGMSVKRPHESQPDTVIPWQRNLKRPSGQFLALLRAAFFYL